MERLQRRLQVRPVGVRQGGAGEKVQAQQGVRGEKNVQFLILNGTY